MLKQLFKRVFPVDKWEIVYFTQDISLYGKIRGKLLDNNIEVKSKIINNSAGRGNSLGKKIISYNILVKEQDVSRAHEIIHSR